MTARHLLNPTLPISHRVELDSPQMSRRRFLLAAGATGLLVACSKNGASKGTPGTLPAPAGGSNALNPGSSDGILVIVEFNGGNDALNTLVPIVGKYHDIRPELGLADDSLIPIPGTTAYGLNPELEPIRDLVEAKRVTTLAGIGWENPNRSHFAALDMWWQATPGNVSPTGWLGRGLDAIGATSLTDTAGVSIGPGGTALIADQTTTTAVNSMRRFRLEPPPGADKKAVGAAWAAMSPAYADAFAAIGLFADLADADPEEDSISATTGGKTITAQLISAARLVVSDPSVRTIYVTARGFDTHANEAKRHAELMKDFAVGVRTFFERIELAGMTDRVMMMTVSEFGRRTYENASGGTDHGKAGALFIIGPNTTGQVYGDLNVDDLDDGDMKPQIDPRSLYAVGLDWLGAPTDEVLGQTFPRYI